ncbi:MAG: site-specific integrase [Parachlamydia sp.]|nr:site-specific integrase [Parachlamydia sp.]
MSVEVITHSSYQSFQQAYEAKRDLVWNKLDTIRVEDTLDQWFATLGGRTRINYISGMRRLTNAGLIDPMITLQAFSLVNHDAIVDKIKHLPEVQETTRQARAALYISFTRYLSRRFPDVFKKAMPSREGTSKTFFRVHEKVVTEAMNQAQWTAFFSSLESINSRDCLIAKITLQGGKRIREVLHLTVEQINWEKREITFTQSKTKGVRKETVITYPESIMRDLYDYIGDRLGYVFISHKGNPVVLNQVANTFARAGKKAGIPFKVTPHVLRASAVTYLKSQGFADSDIQKVTGHVSSEMVNAYDKSDRADNATKRVSLIS